MIRVNDKLLEKCRPNDIMLDKFLQDCEKAVNISELHSDEWSTEDEGLANEEIEQKKGQNGQPIRIPSLQYMKKVGNRLEYVNV